jgi:hypothetical protein
MRDHFAGAILLGIAAVSQADATDVASGGSGY